MSDPATKADLDAVEAKLDTKIDAVEAKPDALRLEHGRKLDEHGRKLDTLEMMFGELLTRTLPEMESRIMRHVSQEVQHLATSLAESFRPQISAVDEKYEHLPGEVAALRADLEAHKADASMHQMPPPSPPRRRRAGR